MSSVDEKSPRTGGLKVELTSHSNSASQVIPADLLERCNTGTTAQKLTNELLRGLYDRDCLASHSISGVINSKRGQPKPALPAHEIQAILSMFTVGLLLRGV